MTDIDDLLAAQEAEHARIRDTKFGMLVPRLLDDCARLRAALRVAIEQRDGYAAEFEGRTRKVEMIVANDNAAMLAALRGGER